MDFAAIEKTLATSYIISPYLTKSQIIQIFPKKVTFWVDKSMIIVNIYTIKENNKFRKENSNYEYFY